jgi:hypothetical protein
MNLFKNLKKVIAWASICIWISIFIILILSSGCSTTKWYHPEHYEWEADDYDFPPHERIEGGWKAIHNYYVIDANADVPDAYFETKSKALTYQKDFAGHHDYVVVKIDKKYNVYNMAKPISLTP